MSGLGIRLLGPPQLELAGQTMKLQRQKAVGLLVYLAVERSNHSRDALAALLWPESSKKNARAAVRRTLSYLNKQLGKGWLRLEGGLVSLNWEEDILLDVAHFQDLLTAAEIQDKNNEPFSEEAIGLLTEAAEIYNNDFLAGFTLPDAPAFDEWQYFQAESLRQQQGQVLAQLVQYHTGMQHLEQAIGYARQRLTLDPLQEEVHRQLMALYSWSGQRHAALRQYQVCVDLLAEELQVEPEESTNSLLEIVSTENMPSLTDHWSAEFSRWVGFKEKSSKTQISNQIHTKRQTKIHRSGDVNSTIDNLPIQVTSFVGRDVEISQISDLLLADESRRLVTLFGPGGIGKTRLAIEAAIHIRNKFEHGVCFVPLTPVTNPKNILSTIAENMNFDFSGSRPQLEQLLDYFRKKNILLILDNFEQLIDGAALLSDILKGAPGIRLLVTSREKLRLQAEWVLEIKGLRYAFESQAISYETYESFQLFMQNARRHSRHFNPEEPEKHSILRICNQVQGLPLAIELIASWVDTLSINQIYDELLVGLDILENKIRDLPMRHQSIRTVFTNSWQRLNPSEQRVFSQLSLFRGGFSKEAAQRVTEASNKVLSVLISKSFVKFNQGENRYFIHELLRQFGLEKLNKNSKQKQNALNSYINYFDETLSRLAKDLKGPNQIKAVQWISQEIENINFACEEATKLGRIDFIEHSVSGIGYFYEWRSNFKNGEHAFQNMIEAISKIKEKSLITAKLKIWVAIFNRYQGDFKEANHQIASAKALLEQGAIEEENGPSCFGFLYLQKGYIVLNTERQNAQQLFKKSHHLYQQANNTWGLANALAALGEVAFRLGKYDESKRYREESLAIRRELGDLRGIASLLSSLSYIAVFDGQFEEGELLTRESAKIYREIGDRASLAHGLGKTGMTLIWYGAPLEAEKYISESLAIHDDLGNRQAMPRTYVSLSVAQSMIGKFDESFNNGHKGLEIAKEVGSQSVIAWALWNLSRLLTLRGDYLQAWEIGIQSQSIYQELNQPEGLGWVKVNLGMTACGLGNLDEAKEYFILALKVGIKFNEFYTLGASIFGVGMLFAELASIRKGRESIVFSKKAVLLVAASRNHKTIANSAMYDKRIETIRIQVSNLLSEKEIENIFVQGIQQDIKDTSKQLINELTNLDIENA